MVSIRPLESEAGTTHAVHHGVLSRDSDKRLLLVTFCEYSEPREEMPDYEEYDEDEVCGRCTPHLR